MTTVAASLNQFHSISNQTFTSMNKITQVLQQNVTVQQNFNKAVEEGNKKTLSLADTVKKSALTWKMPRSSPNWRLGELPKNRE
ncbi:hypothetical protein [Paenibacillus larvae]|uniref:hypothetical protein n=1 Tax=Paenibacillus larvae TaxID=1464 RepID=UPI00122E1CCF|nr:hypothetical protein [Paenibacillus larvae]